MNKSITRNVFFAMTVVVFLVGCSKQVAVTGKVSYTDGSPVQAGQVVFDDNKYAFRGHIGTDGSYKLGGNKDGDGIIPGKYSIYLIDTDVSEMDEHGVVKHVSHVARKYVAPETSGLTCEVKGKMTFDFEVERP